MARCLSKVHFGSIRSLRIHIDKLSVVLGVRALGVPIPRLPTVFTCTLNNGIHFVETPECRLEKDSAIDQEFEL